MAHECARFEIRKPPDRPGTEVVLHFQL